nr:hypothetical protein CFP56_36462 [Quercus suber]
MRSLSAQATVVGASLAYCASGPTTDACVLSYPSINPLGNRVVPLYDASSKNARQSTLVKRSLSRHGTTYSSPSPSPGVIPDWTPPPFIGVSGHSWTGSNWQRSDDSVVAQLHDAGWYEDFPAVCANLSPREPRERSSGCLTRPRSLVFFNGLLDSARRAVYLCAMQISSLLIILSFVAGVVSRCILRLAAPLRARLRGISAVINREGDCQQRADTRQMPARLGAGVCKPSALYCMAELRRRQRSLDFAPLDQSRRWVYKTARDIFAAEERSDIMGVRTSVTCEARLASVPLGAEEQRGGRP